MLLFERVLIGTISYQVPLESVPLDMLQRDELIRKYAQRAEADKKVFFFGGGVAPVSVAFWVSLFLSLCVCVCVCVFHPFSLPPLLIGVVIRPLGCRFLFLCVCL